MFVLSCGKQFGVNVLAADGMWPKSPLARLCAQPAQQAISSFCALCSPTRRRLLTAGPRDPRARVQRWSQHNRLIRGEDLGDAIVDPKEWPVDIDQRPLFLRYGPSGDMIPNPLWEPTAPEQVVEHLLIAARGGSTGDERSWFTGRTAEVDHVVAWIREGTPGMRVVTGSAGTGKSAIIGRVVSLSNPAERARLVGEGGWGIHGDPGERSVHANIHARGLTVDQAASASHTCTWTVTRSSQWSRRAAPTATRRSAPRRHLTGDRRAPGGLPTT